MEKRDLGRDDDVTDVLPNIELAEKKFGSKFTSYAEDKKKNNYNPYPTWQLGVDDDIEMTQTNIGLAEKANHRELHPNLSRRDHMWSI